METWFIEISNRRQMYLMCSSTGRAVVGGESVAVGHFGFKRGRKTSGSLALNLCSMKVSCLQTILTINVHTNPKTNTTYTLMHQAGTASGLTSDHVIQVLRSHSDPKKALRFFFWAARQPKFMHTTDSYNSMLEILGATHMVKEMACVLDLMQTQRRRLNSQTYLIILRNLGITGGMEQVPLALEEMKKSGFMLSDFAYNGLIGLLIKSGFRKEAMVVYRKMISEGLLPSLKFYSTLIGACGEMGDTGQVMGLLAEMRKLGKTDHRRFFRWLRKNATRKSEKDRAGNQNK